MLIAALMSLSYLVLQTKHFHSPSFSANEESWYPQTFAIIQKLKQETTIRLWKLKKSI
jgi:hypothetical protein